MAEQFKIEGLSDLDDALKELPKATSRNVLLRVLKKEGQRIADAGRALAPRRADPSERASGEIPLADSYTVGTKLSRRQSSQNSKESQVEVYVGPASSAKSIQTEFGNAHQAAQPHLRPAFDQNVKTVLDEIARDLADEIEKARKRIARKAERLAQQMGR